jgi:transcriptional repressor NrdR
VATKGLFVIKKDGRREEFQREKLLTGIRKACEKRPLPIGAIEKMVDEIEEELFTLGRKEVHSYIIGDMVMDKLRRLDHIAYIRFASVYRQFTDLASLKEAVDSLAKGETITTQLSLIPHEQRGRKRR